MRQVVEVMGCGDRPPRRCVPWSFAARVSDPGVGPAQCGTGELWVSGYGLAHPVELLVSLRVVTPALEDQPPIRGRVAQLRRATSLCR